ncbi:MAG: phosphotransferase [Candidatus Velthaea sp.]
MSAPAWTADIHIDAPLARRLIAAQFPQLTGRGVEPFGQGWDNAAFLVGGTIVFRFPRRRIVADLIDREIAVLPRIAVHVPLPISAPAFIGRPTADYPWAFAGYPLIRGTTACARSLSDDERVRMAAPLGAFLRALHAIDPQPFAAAGLPRDELGRLDHEKRLAMTRERVSALQARGETDIATFPAWLAAHPPRALHDEGRRVVHGDLYARHIVLDPDGIPAGVIDWGDLHHGDPALDIAIAHLLLPQHAHSAFRGCYGAIDGATWITARYRAVYHAILELDYGIRESDAVIAASARAALAMIAPSLG